MTYHSITPSVPHIKLPIKLTITAETAKHNLGDLPIPKNALFKVFLCKARISETFHSPYVKLLPTLLEINLPYIWAPKYKDLLKGSNLGNSLQLNLFAIIEEWFVIQDKIPDKPEKHYENMKFYYEYKFYTDEEMFQYLKTSPKENWSGFPAYLWASCILKSRSFPTYLIKEYVDYEVAQDEAMLLPLIDLLNHDPKSKVNWVVEDGCFTFSCDNPGEQLYNNYGMKGNEELLLGYGFCLEGNTDSAALKLKVPGQVLDGLKAWNIELPSIEDYTNAVTSSKRRDSSDAAIAKSDVLPNGDTDLLYFITSVIPDNLIHLFEYLVKNSAETSPTLRVQLSGINHLRQAIDQKLSLLIEPSKSSDQTTENIRIYIHSQRQIFQTAIKTLKHKEKELLTTHKKELLTLKNAYKKDVQFQHGLLVGFGVMNYDAIVDQQLLDQCWLLYLLRCSNRDQFPELDLPEWIANLFVKIRKEEISSEEIVQYKEVYLGLIPDLVEKVPEAFGRGSWTVEDLIYSARVLDRVSFVRGKEQECILVNTEGA